MQQGQFFDVSQPCPRVNGASMGNFVGKRVKLVGQVSDVGDGQLKVKAPDGLPITVVLTNAAPNAAIVEFEGLVESPDTLKEESQTIFKEGFDMANYNELCKLACGEYAKLFF